MGSKVLAICPFPCAEVKGTRLPGTMESKTEDGPRERGRELQGSGDSAEKPHSGLTSRISVRSLVVDVHQQPPRTYRRVPRKTLSRLRLVAIKPTRHTAHTKCVLSAKTLQRHSRMDCLQERAT